MMQLHIIDGRKSVYIEEIKEDVNGKTGLVCSVEVGGMRCENEGKINVKGPKDIVCVCMKHLLSILPVVGTSSIIEEEKIVFSKEREYRETLDRIMCIIDNIL
jgi:hypothetical protein